MIAIALSQSIEITHVSCIAAGLGGVTHDGGMPSVDPTEPPRERLLRAADLFAEEGIRAVGITRVLESANTPIATLYRLFGSKDGLVAAFLERRDQQQRVMTEREVDRRAQDGKGKALAVFDYIDDISTESDYRGCTFINAAVETADRNHPLTHIAVGHKQHTEDIFARYLAEAGLREPENLAKQLRLLVDGVFVQSQMQTSDAVSQAKSAAAVLIDNALDRQARSSDTA